MLLHIIVWHLKDQNHAGVSGLMPYGLNAGGGVKSRFQGHGPQSSCRFPHRLRDKGLGSRTHGRTMFPPRRHVASMSPLSTFRGICPGKAVSAKRGRRAPSLPGHLGDPRPDHAAGRVLGADQAPHQAPVHEMGRAGGSLHEFLKGPRERCFLPRFWGSN